MRSASSTYKFAQGLEKTFQLLGKTTNEAAVSVLVPALDSAHQVIQDGALRALLGRRSQIGHRAVLTHLHTAGPSWRDIIEANRGRVMTYTLRGAVLGADPQLCINACRAILWLREYDLVPTLLTALEDDTNPRAKLAAETLLALADRLFEDLASSPSDYVDRRDPQMVRQRFAGSLEASVRRFGQHERCEVMNAFLLLTHRENVTLKQVLQDPHHGVFLTMVDGLLHNPHAGVIQLLLSFLDDPHAPSAAISVLARRNDFLFVRALLRKVANPITPVMAKNLKRVESFAWLRDDPAALGQLDDAAQHALVPLTIASSIPRLKVFRIIEYLIRNGKPAGRISAAEALAHFTGVEADLLVMHALADPDPRVQAAVLTQIRQRGTPGALPHLIEMADSPHECVRQAARESLSEFSIDRYLAAFDQLDEDVRRTTGKLVRKINPHAARVLAKELRIRSRPRRLRALAIADTMEVFAQLEDALIELLADDDHLVRGEAARALAHCPTSTARHALLEALSDRSISVQEAAEKSLAALDRAGVDDLPSAAEPGP